MTARNQLQHPVTEERKRIFLEVLGETGSCTAAARAATPWSTHRAGGLTSFYREAARDPEFAAAWREAEERALGRVEAEVVRRAFTPTRRPVVSNGQIVAYEETYDNNLLIRLAAALNPHKWRVSGTIEVRKNPGPIPDPAESEWLRHLDGEERAELRSLLERVGQLRDAARARQDKVIDGEFTETSDAA